jgi:hypothetical protein
MVTRRPLFLALFLLPLACSPSVDSAAPPGDDGGIDDAHRHHDGGPHPDLAIAHDLAGQVADLAMPGSPDLAGQIADLAVPGSPDLASPVDLAKAPSDMAMAPDLSSGGNAGAPTLLDAVPPSGPAGTLLTVSGAGFQAGDVVEISGQNLAPTALGIVTLAASTIVATVPAVNVTMPASLSVTVRRQTTRTAPRPFTLTKGSVYYVSPNGNDGAAGTLAAPWKTVNGAASKVGPGDVVYLRGGTYPGPTQISASGAAGSPIVFAAYPGESPLLSQPSISSSEVDAVRLLGAYVSLVGLRVSDDNNPGQAIWIGYNAHDMLILECEVSGAHGQGILISGNNNTVLRSRIHDNGAHTPYDHGMYIEGGNNLVRENEVYNNWTFGIQLYNGNGGSFTGNVIEYNYVYHNGYGALAGNASAPSAGIVIANAHPSTTVRYNRFCDNAQYGIYLIDGQDGTQITGNVSCYNHQGGLYLRYPGSGTVTQGNVSYNDSTFALSSQSGVQSTGDIFYKSSGAPSLVWNGSSMSLSSFQAASGQESGAQVADPKFANLPSMGFDSTQADSYSFCSGLAPAFCSPPP